MAMELSKNGILDELGVELLGTKLSAIDQAEDRDLFKQLMKSSTNQFQNLKLSTQSKKLLPLQQQLATSHRPSSLYLGGTGGGMCANEEELREIAENGLKLSPVTQCLIERSIAGFKGN